MVLTIIFGNQYILCWVSSGDEFNMRYICTCFEFSLSLIWSFFSLSNRSAFGKLGELSKKLESMQLLYLWQQQEPSYEMLRDFSGRPDESANEEGEQDILDFEPEM